MVPTCWKNLCKGQKISWITLQKISCCRHLHIRALFLSLQFVYTIAALLCAILQPYKVNFYNKLDTVSFGILAMINAILYYLYSNFVRTLTISTPALVTSYILFLLPMLYISAYVIYWIVSQKESWRNHLDKLLRKLSLVSGHQQWEDEYGSLSIPDRIINPQDYAKPRQEINPPFIGVKPRGGNDQDSPNERSQMRLSSARSYGTNSFTLLSRSSQAPESQVGHVKTVEVEIEDGSTI